MQKRKKLNATSLNTRWFVLLLWIGLAMLPGCSYPKQEKWNPLQLLRWVGSLGKPQKNLPYSHPGVSMKMEQSKLEELTLYREPGSKILNTLNQNEFDDFCEAYMKYVKQYPNYLDPGDCRE